MNYSLHTIEFKKTITTNDYSRAFYFLKRHKSKFYPSTKDGRFWQSDIFIELGIRTFLRHDDVQYPYSEVKFVVNPRLALGDTGYIGIFEPSIENIQNFIFVMNNCLKKIKLNRLTEYHCGKEREVKCSINDFTVSRLDLCVNYTFPTQDIADTYLKLMRQGHWYHFLNDKTTYDKVGKRQKKYPNAIVLNAKTFSISIYSKKDQMIDQIHYFKEIPPQAEGLLRFEIQLTQSKINYIMRQNLCDSLSDLLEQISSISFSEFRRYMKGLFLKGDYVTLAKAKAWVTNAYPKHALEIINFLKLVSVRRSLDTAIAEYEAKELRYDKILRRLNKIMVNPVTLTEEDAKDIQCPLLPSIPLVLGLLKNG